MGVVERAKEDVAIVQHGDHQLCFTREILRRLRDNAETRVILVRVYLTVRLAIFCLSLIAAITRLITSVSANHEGYCKFLPVHVMIYLF